MRKKSEKYITLFIKLGALITIVPVILILLYIVIKGVPSLSWGFLTEIPKDGMRQGGILPAIIGTIIITFGTIVVAVPFGVLTGIYLVEYSKDNMLKRVINLVIINLAGIPSIVYGLFGFAMFVVFFDFGTSILSGSLTLGVMSLPVIITTTKEALLSVPKGMREASLSLGATKWETIWRVVLPAAIPGILTGIILGISRAAGETAPILFTVAALYLPFLPQSIWDQVMVLPYHLYVIATQVPNMPESNMYGTILVLVSITVGFNLFGAYLRNRFRRSR